MAPRFSHSAPAPDGRSLAAEQPQGAYVRWRRGATSDRAPGGDVIMMNTAGGRGCLILLAFLAVLTGIYFYMFHETNETGPSPCVGFCPPG